MVALDIDFVHSTGLTFGLQNVMEWNNAGAELLTAFGVGYTYDAGLWCAGAKLMAVPYENGGMGIDVNGTYWFNESFGLTVIIDYAFSMGDSDWSRLSARGGISVLF
jgi:hypothetical protein